MHDQPSTPLHCATTPAQTPRVLHAGRPVRLVASSITPSQLLSTPSQTSTPPLVFWHSHPSAAIPLASKNPGRQAPFMQVPPLQVAWAKGYAQRTPHRPQLSGSVVRSKPSSITPLQLSSLRLQISMALSIWHSHPFLGSLSRSLKPLRHAK